jgi:hypothetical protein
VARLSREAQFHEWRDAITSDQGPSRPLTRYVLLVLGCWMNESQNVAWPRQQTIERRSGMVERAVRTHLKHAIDEGWLAKRARGVPGKRWRLNEYVARIPEGLAPQGEASRAAPADVGEARRACPSPDGTDSVLPNISGGLREASRAEGAAPQAEGEARIDGKVRHGVPTNSPSEFSIGIPRESQDALARTARTLSNGRSRKPEPETREDLERRLRRAWTMWPDFRCSQIVERVPGATVADAEAVHEAMTAGGQG